MTKHDILTEKEMSGFKMNKNILRYIEDYRNTRNLKKSNMNILDWGCGRGRAVLWLRAHGYNAFGTDSDPEPIRDCRDLFLARGLDADSVLSILENGEEKVFPDAFFNLSFSEEVFEHVKDIERVATNLKRITVSDGAGIHFYPAHKRVMETHLYMPCVHWLPKNMVRKIYIYISLLLGRGPKWKQLEDKTKWEQAQAYYEYIIDKTYYRTSVVVADAFRRNKFKVNFLPLSDFALDKRPMLYKLAKLKWLRPIFDWAMRNFGQIGLLITKESD